MQTILKTILVLIFAGFGVFVLTIGTKANFNAANSAVKNTGATAPKDLYIRNCARCHGADGAGQTEVGQKLDVPDLTISGRRMSAGKVARIITNGADEMPAFGKKLSKKQISSLAAYVRKL